MPIAPEVWQTPGIIHQFARSGLLRVFVRAAFLGRSPARDFAQDGRVLAEVSPSEVSGIENIPGEGACLLVANHPRIDVALTALFRFAASLQEDKNRGFVFLMAGELAIWGELPFPGVKTLLSRFQALYPETIIPVPTIKSRPGYRAGRVQATERARRALQAGEALLVHPEAQTEVGNVILPIAIYRYGAGALVKQASEAGIIQLPLAMWIGPSRETTVRVGEPFLVDPALTDQDAVIDAMAQVAALMPNALRGPFADPACPG